MSKQNEPFTLKEHVGTVGMKDPFGHLNLTMVPLTGNGNPKMDYILLSGAIEAGLLTVSEVSEAGSVPELLVDNMADVKVLLLDGEELIGAKQNRILNTSILLPPKSKTKVPVSCVEQGRWRHTSMQFHGGGYSTPKLRGMKSRDVSRSLRNHGRADSDQGAVWDEVQNLMHETGSSSPTSSMHDAIQQRSETIGGYINALPYPEGARGVIVAIDGRFTAMDLFDQPGTLQKIWPRLITGYTLDAIGRSAGEGKQFTAKGAGILLEQLGLVQCDPCPSVGLGEDWRFESEPLVGQALVVAGACVHLSAFPNGGSDHDGPRGPRILPPSRRRRNRHKEE